VAQPITIVDAFTEEPFRGNPAAVCLMNRPRDEAWMRSVAREMNLAETAFLGTRADGWTLRWFTPEAEVDLCGHATLACAHVLFEEGRLSPEGEARFHTRSGVLTACRRFGWIEMDFPSTPAAAVEPPRELAASLGARPVFTGQTSFDYLVELEHEDRVRELRPNISALAGFGGRGVIVTAAAAKPARGPEAYDFVSRFFAPAVGIAEDPVTGSAHCALGPYWAERLHKGDLLGYQCSARGGFVRVRPEGNRVILGGRAITVLRGELVEP
jgi:predicted PhzF superfamily epimerase YddE/YHI9